jgi:hypothetical protein
MTNLEAALVVALVFMLAKYYIANRKAMFFKGALIAVGKRKITVEVDETDMTFQLVPTEQSFTQP